MKVALLIKDGAVPQFRGTSPPASVVLTLCSGDLDWGWNTWISFALRPIDTRRRNGGMDALDGEGELEHTRSRRPRR